ncbi:MAG: serine/threonine protein kinase [Deltaproteobacteria bacterium]|nr:serine/threonine protein kinase [Deltaproteobacteria bacterium]
MRTSLKPGLIIDDFYKIVSPVKSGGQATLYKALEKDGGRVIALKLITRKDEHFSKNLTRLKYEYQALDTLKGIEQFLNVHRFRAKRNYAYLAMDWMEDAIDGERFIQQNSPMEWKSWLWLAKIIARGLSECHKRSIIHKDIKPQNILFGKKGAVKIIDFGIAQHERTFRLNGNDINAGTISYMPPEQIIDGEYGIVGEMYALGVTLYEFLAGKVPFYADNPGEIMNLKIKGQYIPPTRINPNLPEGTNDLFYRLLSPAPSDRIQGARELMILLSDLKGLNPSEELIAFHKCRNCQEDLWKELPFCSHCGTSYMLEVIGGDYGIIANNIQNPDHFINRFEKLTSRALPSWRFQLFKSTYPRVFLNNVSEYSAVLVADALSDDNGSLQALEKPYLNMLHRIRFSLPQILLLCMAFYCLISGVNLMMTTLPGEPAGINLSFNVLLLFIVSFSAIGFSCGYAFMPLASVAMFGNMARKRNWPALHRFKDNLSRLNRKRLQIKASALIRRSVMLYDRIENINLSSELKKGLITNLEAISFAGLHQLQQMNNNFELLENFRKKGILKKITALESSLKTTSDIQMIKEMTYQVGELTKIQIEQENLDQHYAADEISFSNLLASINNLLFYVQQRDFKRLQDEMRYTADLV